MIYIVSYTYKSPLTDHLPLERELAKSKGWCRYLDSTWLIDTEEKPEELNNRLLKHIKKVFLLIVQLHPLAKVQGWLPKEVWEWISEHRETQGHIRPLGNPSGPLVETGSGGKGV